MTETDKEKIKNDVRGCFIERNKNTIREKISDLVSVGFNEDEARHTVIQIVKNLSNDLLPLKTEISQEISYSDKLTLFF